ncbi:MAG TPA: PEGA domain-containing protein [Polyangium sp.]|nr:PEGA domain-containing protein [Polyangium sp.]
MIRKSAFRGLTPAVFLTFAPLSAQAQTAENAAMAEALFQEAQKLIASGKISEACPKFVESDRLDPGLGTKLSIADCHEREGKLAKAWAEFTEVVSLAQAAKRKDRETLAKQRANALAPRVPKLVITLKGADPNSTEILRDGQVLGNAALGVPLPIDPGSHTLLARSSGYNDFTKTVDIQEGKTVEVEIPALERKPAVTPPPPPSGSSRDTPGPSNTKSGSSLVIGGAVVAGVGVVAVGIGSWFGVKTFDTWEQATTSDQCAGKPGNYVCTEAGASLARQAQTNGNISTALFVGGGVALGVGAVMLAVGVRAKGSSKTTGLIWILPSVDANKTGLLLQGRF